jgi:plastocyanin domain-containing protein
MIIINLTGLLLIALIVWWFWLYKPAAFDIGEDVRVIVLESGSYQPAHLRLKANTPTRLSFMRKDPSPCAESLLIPELHISESLALNKVKQIKLPALPAGEYPFHCQMQMYRGVLTVVDE